MQRLKTIKCCWWCARNFDCDPEGVCKIERPCIEECTDCDTYKDSKGCKDFVEKP